LVVMLVVVLVVMLVVMLVAVLVVVLFILSPQQAPIKDIHDGTLNECLGIVYIPICSLRCGCPQLFLRRHGQSRPPCSLGCPLALKTMTIPDNRAKEEREGRGRVMEIEHNT
jgi:hypothetical protein